MRSLSLLVCCLVVPLAAQDMPTPGKEHQQLAAAAGTWDAAIEGMGPDGQASLSKGVSERRMLGGFWLIDDFTADMGGMPFIGHGMTGYDPEKKVYVGTWTDSMSPALMLMEGTYDKSGKVLTMTGMGPGMDGKPTKMRMVSTMKDANTEVFEMFQPGPEGKEMRTLKITYTRRAAGAKSTPAAPAKK